MLQGHDIFCIDTDLAPTDYEYLTTQLEGSNEMFSLQ